MPEIAYKRHIEAKLIMLRLRKGGHWVLGGSWASPVHGWPKYAFCCFRFIWPLNQKTGGLGRIPPLAGIWVPQGSVFVPLPCSQHTLAFGCGWGLSQLFCLSYSYSCLLPHVWCEARGFRGISQLSDFSRLCVFSCSSLNDSSCCINVRSEVPWVLLLVLVLSIDFSRPPLDF